MKKLTTLQQLKLMYTIQICIILWCIKTFAKYALGFKLWFNITVFGVFGWALAQLCCRFMEVAKLKDLEK